MFTDSILLQVGFTGVFLHPPTNPSWHLGLIATLQTPGLIRGQLQGEDNRVTYLAIPVVQPAGDNSQE